jgi:DNA-binding transcriptional LysR family regulator
MLKLRHLEIFREIMLRGTVTAAAKRLQISQPSATSALHHLERRLGFRLFAREKGRLQPTTEAHSLFREVEKIFGTVEVVEKYALDLKDAQSGLLTLAATPTLAHGLLARAVAKLRLERPRVRVLINALTTTRDVVELSSSGLVDLGVIHTPADVSNVAVHVLFETSMVCAVRRDHPLAAKSVITSQDLAGIPVITNIRNEQISTLLEQALPNLDLQREVMIGTNLATAACALVVAGAGAALVEPMTVGALFPEIVLLPFHPPIAIVGRAIHGRTRPLSLIGQHFLRILTETAADLSDTPAPPNP